MKTLLLFICCFFTVELFAQNITASATKQDWASGICYQTGTIYVISINGDSTSLKNIEIHYAIIDGHKFDITLNAQKIKGPKSVSYQFEVSQNRHGGLGIDIEDAEEPAQYEGCYVKITFENRQIKIPIEPVTELMYIAYP